MTPSTKGIPLLVPDMPKISEILPYLALIDESKHYTNFGPLVCQLEKNFSEFLDVQSECLTTVSSATAGLELALKSLDLPIGAKVLVPGFTFVASITSIINAGFLPVVCDVDEKNWLLTPEIAKNIIRKQKIDAVLAVCTFGMPQPIDEWDEFERQAKIPVIIDAAAAFGSQKIGAGNSIVVFSLHATKSLPAGEGGLVVSRKHGVAKKVRELSNFGINLVANSQYRFGELSSFGINAKMSEYHAAVCLASLKKWKAKAEIRRRIRSEYKKYLISYGVDKDIAWQEDGPAGSVMAPTLLCVKFLNVDQRRDVEKKLSSHSIAYRRWYQPILSEMKLIKEKYTVLDVENCINLSKTVLGLPFFIDLDRKQIDQVSKCFV